MFVRMPHTFSIGIQSRFRACQSRFVIFLALNHCFVDLDARMEALSCCKSPSKVYIKVVRNFQDLPSMSLNPTFSFKNTREVIPLLANSQRTFILMFAIDLGEVFEGQAHNMKNHLHHLSSIIFVTLSHASLYDICCRGQLSLAYL